VSLTPAEHTIHGVLVQVYGTTTVADARAIDGLGLDHMGIVPDEGFPAWDAVDFDTARAIASALTNTRLVVASLSPEAERVVATVQAVQPAVIHLARAGDMDAITLERIRASVGNVELMATVPVLDDSAVAVAKRLAPFADYLLLDTKDPDSGAVGATGLVHDWQVSTRIVNAVDVPVLLAGGLGPDNVARAIATVRPAGVDSETRTSRGDDRRRKDLDKVEAFVAAARGAAF
jgi:phosphoribosylanthranilate isomerase